MYKILISLLLLITVLSCNTATQKKQIPPKTNVLMICVDDLNDWSSCLGNHPKAKTPNIDLLASQGIIFKNAHCQAPICGPSRASILTGLHPHTTGIYYQVHDADIKKCNELTAGATFLPDYFEQNGYESLGVGKIFHQGDASGVFDKYGGVFPKMQFGPKPKERMNFNPKWFSDSLNTATDWGPIDMPDSEMSDYKIADWAVKELNQEREKPFFMAVGFVRPHVPWHVPQKWFDMFPVDEMVTPPYKADDLNDVPEASRILHDMPQMPKTEWLIKENKWKPMVQAYLASMAFMDHQLGKVLDALKNSPYADNTVVVLWSDHGYHLGEKNRTCKHSLWNRSTHVPLIFAGKSINASTSCNTQVGLIDVYPTLLDYCGLPKNNKNQGNNLMPLVREPNRNWDKPVLTSYGYKNISIYKQPYHYIQYADGSGELYDMKNDPNEWDNLAELSDFSQVKKDMQKLLPSSHAEPTKFVLKKHKKNKVASGNK